MLLFISQAASETLDLVLDTGLQIEISLFDDHTDNTEKNDKKEKEDLELLNLLTNTGNSDFTLNSKILEIQSKTPDCIEANYSIISPPPEN